MAPKKEESVTILITGGAGFVGSRIVHALLTAHPTWKLVVTDIVAASAYTAPSTLQATLKSQITYKHLDVTSLASATQALKDPTPTLVVHTAGMVPGGLDRYGQTVRRAAFALNEGGTAVMLEAVRAAGIRLFVHTSSCCAVTDDLDRQLPNYSEEDTPYVDPARSLVYGASKAAAECLVLDANDPPRLHTLALRPSVILGEHDYQLVPSIAACIPKGETPWIIGSGENLYDFTYVENVAHAHLLGVRNLLHFHHFQGAARDQVPSTSKSAAGLAINISNDEPITFRDFCLAIWKEHNHVPPFQMHVPIFLAWFAGLLAEIWGWCVGGRTTLCRGSVKDAYSTRYADLTRAKTLLGFEPVVGLREGIRRSCKALKNEGVTKAVERA